MLSALTVLTSILTTRLNTTQAIGQAPRPKPDLYYKPRINLVKNPNTVNKTKYTPDRNSIVARARLLQDDNNALQLPDGTYIENISSITGITQFSTWIQVHSAMFELVNKTLQLTVTFEKQIASTASS